MRDFALLLVLTACVFLGCHKKQPAPAVAGQSSESATPEAQSSSPPQAQSSQPTAPLREQIQQSAPPPVPLQPAKPLPPPPKNITAIADNNLRQGVVGEVDGTLTSLLRRFVQKSGRMPQSFSEFASG